VTFADLGAAAVAVVLALVPAAIVLLALHSLGSALRLDERLGRRGYQALAGVIGAGVALVVVTLTWAFAGANYLKPRCQAFAAPAYASAGDDRAPPVASAGLQLDAGQPPPAWAADLVGPGRFAFYLPLPAGGGQAGLPPAGPSPGEARVILRVRRSGAQVGYWLRLGTDHFEVIDRITNARLAVGEELWVDAGAARYRCGIASGPFPVRARDYPAGDGVFQFVRGAVRPPAAPAAG
jgi:hypothetical protein